MSIPGVLQFLMEHPLSQGAKLQAFSRFVKWQVESRLRPGDHVHEWIGGSRFLVRNGETGLTGNIYTGLHEFPDMGFLLHFLRPEDLFVDVGANVGSYTILACAAKGARGCAFEPVPETFRRLAANLRINHLEDRVQAFHLGLGDRQGSIRFTTDLGPMNHVAAAGETGAGTVEVPVTTLDEALGAAAPALMKIDVEGYETPVLEGAGATLRKPSLQAVIMELNGSGARFGYDEARIVERMAQLGFEPFAYDPFRRTLTASSATFPREGNTLFVRNPPAVLERLRSAPPFEVFGRSV